MNSWSWRRIATYEATHVAVATAFAGIFAAAVAVARVDSIGPLGSRAFEPVTSLPVSVIIVAFAGVAAALAALRNWWLGVALFFIWLPLEDLVRKFSGNDLRVYWVKDALLALALLAVFQKLRSCWRQPLGPAWLPTVLLLSFALLMSVPTAMRDPRIPVGALHLRFVFILLLPIGVLIGRDRATLVRALTLLCWISIAACSVGIWQGLFGLEFLNPADADPLFKHLTITKALGTISLTRPPGTFVDAARFGTFTTVSLVLGGALRLIAPTTRTRLLALATLVTAAIAAFVSGGRTPLLFGIVILFSALTAQAGAGSRRRSLALAALVVLGAGLILSGRSVGNSQAAYYAQTLSGGQNSEVSLRFRYYSTELAKGFKAGGLQGRGTGDQAIGQQYFSTSTSYSAENGFGSLATEWGPLGVLLWLVWTTMWLLRLKHATRFKQSASGPITSLILVFVTLNLTVGFALGIQFFENYVTNMFLWFLTGVALAAIPTNDHPQNQPPLEADESAQDRPLALIS